VYQQANVHFLAVNPSPVRLVWATDGLTQVRRDDGGAQKANGFAPNKERASLYELAARRLPDGNPVALWEVRPDPQFPGDPLPAMFQVYDPAVHSYVAQNVQRRAQQAEMDVAIAKRQVDSHNKQAAHAGSLDNAGKLPGKK
jgi:hypothetical protein